MKGYGLTVFQGVDVESFPVEVVSVVHDSEPGRGAIWIRCTDERMATNGLVQGMSGSPIYLWAKGEPQVLGKGGKLIGAFAFGFINMKVTIVGVQPIEHMREVGERALTQKPRAHARLKASHKTQQMLTRMIQMGQQRSADTLSLAQANIMRKLMLGNRQQQSNLAAGSQHEWLAPPSGMAGQAVQLRMPVTVQSPVVAALLNPLLEPMGMTAVSGIATSKAPAWIDLEKIKFAPGSVLAIPLAWGDLDLSASGTVTDVLPDGRVIAFGHALSGGGKLGEGPSTLPIATGYVHSVIPRNDISFKMGGSGVIHGTLVREENAAVVGVVGKNEYSAADVNVAVHMPDQPARKYNYKVVRDPSSTPLISAIVALQSLQALQGPPMDSTLRIESEMTFDDGHVLKTSSISPNAMALDILLAIAPPISTMGHNQHGSTFLKNLSVKMSVEPRLMTGVLTQARLDSGEVSPGDDLHLTLRVQPYGGDAYEKRVSLTVPSDTPEGAYALTICDARTYVPLLITNRPHLLATDSLDALFNILQRIVGVPNDNLFVILQLKKKGLAIGQQELADLPSSRKALIATSTSTIATPYNDWVETRIDNDLVIPVNLNFAVTVKEAPAGE